MPPRRPRSRSSAARGSPTSMPRRRSRPIRSPGRSRSPLAGVRAPPVSGTTTSMIARCHRPEVAARRRARTSSSMRPSTRTPPRETGAGGSIRRGCLVTQSGDVCRFFPTTFCASIRSSKSSRRPGAARRGPTNTSRMRSSTAPQAGESTICTRRRSPRTTPRPAWRRRRPTTMTRSSCCSARSTARIRRVRPKPPFRCCSG